MRKKSIQILSILLVLFLTFSLAGCGTAKPSSTTEPQKKFTLTLFGSQNWFKDIHREVFKDLESETGIIIDLQASPDDQFDSMLRVKLGANELPDIVTYYNGATGETTLQADKNFVEIGNEPFITFLNPYSCRGQLKR